MTVSEKQLEANRQNALKGGVKTPEGKEIVKYNAIKHGLLAKEVVTIGEGAENPEEFDALLEDLNIQLKPEGTLEEIYDWDENWRQLYYKFSELVPEDAMDSDEEWIRQLREFLNNKAGWSDDQIWQAHIELCDDRMKHHREQMISFEKQKVKNKLKLQVIKKLGSIPSKDELDRLLRYEGAIERQLYKAINQLERQQKLLPVIMYLHR